MSSAAVIAMTALVLGEVEPAFKRLDPLTGLERVSISLEGGGYRFSSSGVENWVSGANYSHTSRCAITANNGFKCDGTSIDFKDVWRSQNYVSFTNPTEVGYGFSRTPLSKGLHRMRCSGGCATETRPFAGLIRGHSDASLHAAVLAWLKDARRLPVVVFEAAASKNPRERSEIFFDGPDSAAAANELAFLLRPLIGPVEPKTWPSGAMPSPHQVLVIIGKQRVPEPAPPKLPDASAPKVTVLQRAVTPPTRERLRNFVLNHTFGFCSAVADGGMSCTRADSTTFSPGDWSTSDAGFRVRVLWEHGLWGAPLYEVEATAMNDDVVLGSRAAGYDEPDLLVAWVCGADKKCDEMGGPAVKVLAASDHPSLRAIQSTRFDDLKQPSGPLETPVFFAPTAPGAKLSITYSWMWRAHALAIAERLAPMLGPVPVNKAAGPLAEVEEPFGVVLDLGPATGR